VFPGRRRHSGSWLAIALLIGLCVGCAGPDPDPEPWERPVDGAAGATPWTDGGTPASPFGPGGYPFATADDLVASLAASLEASGVDIEHALVPGDDPDLVVGWVRLADPDDPVAPAMDMRLRIERDGETWSVTGVEERRHCRDRPEADRCPGDELTETPDSTGTAAPSPGSAGGVYLAFGDSVTFGIGVPRPQENGFVARVATALADANPPIAGTRVFAVPGETAGGFLGRRLDDVVDAIEELGPRVELVTIGLGANELLRTRRDPTCEDDPGGDACRAIVDAATLEAAEALDAVVAAVQATLASEGSDARLLLLAYYNPDVEPIAAATMAGTDGVVGCDAAEPAPGLNDRIACVAARRGIELVDLYGAFLGREDELTRFGEGDVHPNAEGYAVIAEEILAVIGGADS
jgi:lysophospholipase L1-like esterase